MRTMAMVLAMLLVACSGGTDTPDTPDASTSGGETASSETTVGTIDESAERPAGMLDCEWRGEPCTLGEVPADVLEATDVLLSVAAGYLGVGIEPAVLADAFAEINGVVETAWDDLGVFFRMEDGPPAWVLLDEIDGQPVDGGWGASTAPAPLSVVASSARTGSLASVGGPVGGGVAFAQTGGGSGGIAGTPGEGKRALVVSPYAFDVTADIGPFLEQFRDFTQRGGRVELRVDGDPVAPSEVLAPFMGWSEFDTIVVGTHGVGICKQGPDGELLVDETGGYVGCRTVLSAGEVTGTLEEAVAAIGDTPGVVVTRKTSDTRTDLPYDEIYRLFVDVCLPALAAYPTTDGMAPCSEPLPETEQPVQVGLTVDFFTTVYPDGLPDRLIAIMACQSMRFTDIAGHLQGGSGVVLGHPEIVFSYQSAVARSELVGLLTHGRPVSDALAANAVAHPAGEMGSAHLVHLGNDTLRAVDVVALMDGDNELVDGAFMTLTGGDAPAIEMTVRVKRVGDEESPDAYAPEIWIDGEPALRGVTLTTENDGQWYSDVVAVPLPDDFEVGDTFDAEVRVALPDGGESRWRYEDLRTAIAISYRSHVSYVFPTHTFEAVMVAEGPLEQGPDGWQASIPMRWESVELSGIPSCRVSETTAVSRFEVMGGELTADGATLRWGVEVGGDGTEIRDTVELVCTGLGGGMLAETVARGMGAAVGVAGMIVIHGPDPAAMAWVADNFVASDEPGVLLEHTQTGTYEEISAEVRIQLLADGG